MGFEDDFSYNDDFETDIADPDNMDSGEQPKKLSRKELREAKKKNAEKTADLPKQKRGFLSRRERLDDNDASLTEEHMFDPSRSTMISTPRDRSSRETGMAPVRSRESEFSYLFDPVDDDESEDDVYPDSSIYSDDESARDLLAGLSYDGSKESDVRDFEDYFDEHSEPPESKFSFRKKNKKQEKQPETDDIAREPEFSEPAPVKVTPKKAAPPEEESFLPEMRPDSVFKPQPAPEPMQDTDQRNDAPLPPLPGHDTERRRHDDRNNSFDKHDNPDEDEYYMNNDQEKDNQVYTPYSGLYPSYPMTGMNQMMPYPVVIPNGGQNQSGGYPIQTIPIPYPMPMPMPMPMYGQYPSYQPQYPPYPQQEPYGRNQYDDRRDSRDTDRHERRFNEHRRRDDRRYYDDRRDDRYDDRRYYDDRRDDRYDDRRYYEDRRDDRYDDRRYYDDRRDGRYDDRRDGRYDDRRDGRYDDRRDDRYYRRDDRRESYPQPPYDPPYRRREEVPQSAEEVRRNEPAEAAAPIVAPQPIAEPVQTAPPVQENPVYTPSPFAGTDFSFRPQPQQDAPAAAGFEDGGFDEFSSGGDGFEDAGLDGFSSGGDGFEDAGFDGFLSDDDGFGDSAFDDDSFDITSSGSDPFGGDAFGDGSADGLSDDGEEDDFGLGFGGRSISSDRPKASPEAETKPSGGRFKKRK